MRKYTVVFLLVLASACASTSKEDVLAASYATVTQAATSTESLYRQKLISKEKGTKVFEALQASLKFLDQARDMFYLGKSKESEEALKQAQAAREKAKTELKGGSNASGT